MLFQPSNIYPSTFSGIGAGTVDVTQGLNVSWQVNGGTPMTAYQIKIYQNDTNSTLMYDSGKQTVTPAFEPHDRLGNPTFFNTLISAASMSSAGIVNGYQYGYKMLITQWWGANDYVEQTSASVFITRSTPTLVIDAIPSPVTSNSYTITATYTQAEGDPISTVEWVFAQAGNESTPIKETGAISTQVLSFDADGLITGNTYSIMCNIVTANGMEASTGFIQFNVSYPSISGDIGVQVAQMKNSSAVYLSWNQIGGNVLKYPYTDDTKTVNGITFTVNGEGDISVSGTASDDATFDLESGTLSQLKLTAGEKLLITTLNDNFSIRVTETDDDSNVVSTVTGTSPMQYIVPDTQNTLTVSVLVYKGAVLTDETIQPMMYIEDDIVSLDDLYVTMSPIQDLNGYDSPWPAGGGKNKLQITATTQTINDVTFTVNSNGSVTVNGTASANAVFVLNSYTFDGTSMTLNGCPSGGSGSTYKLDAFGSSGLSEDIGSGVSISTSGTRNVRIVVFSGTSMTNKVFWPMLRLSSDTDATYAPYSNLCPISGRTGCEVYRTGVNVWDEEWELGGVNNQNGTLWTATDRIRSKNFIPCLPNTEYYLKCPTMVSTVAFYDADNTFISAVANFAGNATFTTPSNAKYIKFGVAGAYGTTYDNDIAINYPSTDHDYHAYQGNQFSVEFPAVGANQWDEQWEVGNITTIGTDGTSYDRIRSVGYIPVQPETVYYRATPNNVQPFFYNSDKTFISYGLWAKGSFTTPENCYYVRFQVDPAYGTTYDNDIAINYPATVTTYEPYTKTVFSGTVDIVTGEAVADMAKDIVPIDSATNPGGTSWFAFTASSAVDITVPPLSNYYVGKTYATNTDMSVFPSNVANSKTMYIKDSRFSGDLAGFKSFYNAQTDALEVCYKLAEPITFHVAPNDIPLMFGQNNVFSDAGSVTLTYETNMGRKETLSGDIVSFSNSKAVPIPEPEFRPGVLGVEVYRYSQDDPILRRIYSFQGDTNSFLDYYAPSQKPVSYLFVAHGSSEDVFVVTDQFKPTFWFYSILLCSQDSNGNYHVEKEYVFRYGVESGNVSNNNEPTIQRNFTPYPNRQPVSSLYKTGKVTGYIGTVSGAKVYSDSVALQNAIYAISASPLTKFLKTRKGDVIMVDTASSIQMKTDDKTVEQALKATIDWVEMGDTEGLSIVSIPTDSFWPID